MRNRFALLALLVVCLAMVGCASKKKETQQQLDPSVAQYERFRQNYDAALKPDLDDELIFDNGTLPKGNAGTTGVVLQRAHNALGTPYVFGGTRPGGFDCSGLVQWAYKNEGISLPRTAREQSQVGTRITDVEEMRAGDIVAFRHPRRGYHTGIYVGDGKFIHSPHRRDRVKISSLSDPYFRTTFLGARRVSADAEAAIARAQSQLEETSSERLVEYREEQAVRELRKSRQERAEREKVSKSKKSRDKKERASSDSRRKSKSSLSVAERDSKKKSKVKSGSSRSSKSAKSSKSSSRKKVARDSRKDSRKSVSRSKSRSEKSRKESSRKSSSKKTEKKSKS